MKASLHFYFLLTFRGTGYKNIKRISCFLQQFFPVIYFFLIIRCGCISCISCEVLNKIVLMGNFLVDCEHLLRRMLVLDPIRRYTVSQIKKHRWTTAEESPRIHMDPPEVVRAERTTDPNEQVLRVMQELGIDIARTREVRNLFSLIHRKIPNSLS